MARVPDYQVQIIDWELIDLDMVSELAACRRQPKPDDGNYDALPLAEAAKPVDIRVYLHIAERVELELSTAASVRPLHASLTITAAYSFGKCPQPVETLFTSGDINRSHGQLVRGVLHTVSAYHAFRLFQFDMVRVQQH